MWPFRKKPKSFSITMMIDSEGTFEIKIHEPKRAKLKHKKRIMEGVNALLLSMTNGTALNVIEQFGLHQVKDRYFYSQIIDIITRNRFTTKNNVIVRPTQAFKINPPKIAIDENEYGDDNDEN